MKEFSIDLVLTLEGVASTVRRHWRGIAHDVVFYTGVLVWACIIIILLGHFLGG